MSMAPYGPWRVVEVGLGSDPEASPKSASNRPQMGLRSCNNHRTGKRDSGATIWGGEYIWGNNKDLNSREPLV